MFLIFYRHYIWLFANLTFLGVTVPSREGTNHHIRVFPLSSESDNKAECRSNQNYDQIMAMDSPTEDQRKGYLGKCALRSVQYFDVGESFLTDSLHNLYGGAMVSILWFKLDEIEIIMFIMHSLSFASI